MDGAMSETFAYSEINSLYVSDSEAGTFKTQMKSVLSHEIFSDLHESVHAASGVYWGCSCDFA